jgi:penicillin amidase
MKHPLKSIIAVTLCVLWVMLMNTSIGDNPAMGKLVDPIKGFWANAEQEHRVLTALDIPHHKQIQITFNERLVPHIVAEDEEALYYAQGYLHARYRLWQMDMLTRAAAGRLSEVLGDKTLNYDRGQRRKGLVWAAENSLRAMEAVPETKKMLDAYTAGVNDYIKSLQRHEWPLEYKLMQFKPEPWSNLKCALLLKYMADDLTGTSDDIAMSYLRSKLGAEEMDYLFPDNYEQSVPVIPSGTPFKPATQRIPSRPSGEIFANFDSVKLSSASVAAYITQREEARGKGSNNWAINGNRTADGVAILCNDPHLGLNLPAIWYELHMTAPGINCYGVSIPGAPSIVIGFNNEISWGFTNNYRDVKDFYEIKSEDDRFYIFDGKKIPFNQRIERIEVKGMAQPFLDTVCYTIHGPITYEPRYPDALHTGKKLAMSWMAHRATNELLCLYKLNRAQDYQSFIEAIKYFECPAQNFAYADRQGNIAMWGQGTFINKWKDQGKYVMRGDLSATLWGNTIPQGENPHVLNPAQNYVASANQRVTDYSYPYWYNGDFTEFRGRDLHHFLNDSNVVTISSMQALQNNNFSIVAQDLYDIFMQGAHNYLTERSKKYVHDWNNQLNADSKAATLFQLFSHFVFKNIWEDEFGENALLYPSLEQTIHLLTKDTNAKYFDNINTPERENIHDVVKTSILQASDSFDILEKAGTSYWYQAKATSLIHLTKIPAFSYLSLPTGGWGTAINAMKRNHGPSWRMVVHMGREQVSATVVYPGGQSGNPGSKYYGNSVDHWAKGLYYPVRLNPVPSATQN